MGDNVQQMMKQIAMQQPYGITKKRHANFINTDHKETAHSPRWSMKYHSSVTHLAWKKRFCCGRAAFDITFQDKTTLFLKTRKSTAGFCDVAEV